MRLGAVGAVQGAQGAGRLLPYIRRLPADDARSRLQGAAHAPLGHGRERRPFLPSRTAHPLGTPPHPASATVLALGNPVQSRPGTAASDSTPSLTTRLQLTRHPANRTSPQTRASPVRERLLLRPLPAISPCPTSPDGHKVSPRRLKTDTGPNCQKSCPDHRLLLPLIAHSAAVTSYLRWIRA